MVEPAELRVSRVGADGDGVAELADGTPFYLAGTLPGETVLAHRVKPRGEGWAGQVDAVIAPSPDRAAPPCPHFGSCGGCTLQHWQDAPYRAWKAGLLQAALRRAGYAAETAPLVATPHGTRRRMDLALRRKGGLVVVGLHAARAAEVVDLRACPVLHPALFALVASLRAALPGLALLRREGSAVVNLLENGPDLLLRTDGEPTTADRTRLADFARAHGLCRITWSPDNGAQADGAGETLCLLKAPEAVFAGVAVRPPPGAFLQASREGEAAIVAAVLAGLPEKLPGRALVGDFYAGCGTLSFALARRARVAAYEGDAGLAAALRSAANTQGLAGRIAVTQRDLARRPVTAAELAGCAAVVLDPPYAGAAAQMAQVAAARVKRVVVASCNPAALARDAAILHRAGYAVLSAVPIDQFPWSARLESVVVFATA